MLTQFGQVFIFMILAIAMIAFIYLVVYFLAPHKPSKEKRLPYECGEDTVGLTWIKFNIRFYVAALIFIIFDVEIVFVFPWAVVFREIGFLAYAEMFVFLTILIIGLFYAIVNDDLTWDKPEPVIPSIDRKIFKSGN